MNPETIFRSTLVRGLDGWFNSGNPSGAGTELTLYLNVAGFPTTAGLRIGTPYSFDFSDLRSGTGVGSETWGLEAITGGDPGAYGWTVLDTTLSNAGEIEGSCSFYLVGTISGAAHRFGPFAASYIAAPVGDYLAPPRVTRLTATPASGGVLLSCDTPWDAHDGFNMATGMRDIQFLADGLVIGTVAVNAGNSPAMTSGAVGTISVNSASRTGNDWYVSAEGITNGSADAYGYGAQVPVTGDFVASVYVESIANSQPSCKSGIMWRESTATDAAFVHAMAFSGGTKIEYRPTTGGTRANAGANNYGFYFPGWCFLTRVGNIFTMYFGNLEDSNAPTQIAQLTLAAPVNGVLHLPAISNSLTGNPISVQYRHWCVTQLPRASYTHSVSSGSRSYTARARDKKEPPNIGAASAAVVAAPLTGVAKKWHPGNYLDAQPTQVTGKVAPNISLISGLANFKGAKVTYGWGLFEPTRRVFDFSRITADRNSCASIGKKMVIWLNDATAAAQTPPYHIDTRYIPAWLETSAYAGGWAAYNYGVTAKYWIPAVMDEEIACIQAMGDQFDADPVIEGIILNFESARAFTNISGGAPSDYSDSACITQLLRLADAAATSWPRTNIFLCLNWLYPSSLLSSATAHLFQKGVGVYGPDFMLISEENTWEDLVFAGDPSYGGINYRGRMPHAMRWGDVTNTSACASTAIGDQPVSRRAITHTFWLPLNAGDWGLVQECQAWSTPTGVVASVNAVPNNNVSSKPECYSAIDTS